MPDNDDTRDTELGAPPRRAVGRETLAMARRLVLTRREQETATPADNGDETSDNDVKLARIKAGNVRIMIIGGILIALASLAVFAGNSLTASLWGAEVTLGDDVPAEAAPDYDGE